MIGMNHNVVLPVSVSKLSSESHLEDSIPLTLASLQKMTVAMAGLTWDVPPNSSNSSPSGLVSRASGSHPVAFITHSKAV